MLDPFAEYEQELWDAHQRRIASGEDAAERRAFRARGVMDRRRMGYRARLEQVTGQDEEE